MRYLLVSTWLALAVPLAAQANEKTVDPGMTKSQVVAALGAPASQRNSGSLTFLYYSNGCEKTCGMQDLVILDHDAVVDAIFRAPARRYTGTSTSPRQWTSQEAAKSSGKAHGALQLPAAADSGAKSASPSGAGASAPPVDSMPPADTAAKPPCR